MVRHPGKVKTPFVVTKETKILDFPHLYMSQMLYFEKFIQYLKEIIFTKIHFRR